jgi:uncharacterized protein YeaO (DUF488 family)
MTIRIVRLGAPRAAAEGLRLGAVRHPPRGVPKEQYASRDFFDLWFPTLAPSAELLKAGRTAADDRAWAGFRKRFRSEMRRPEASRVIELLAVLSHQTNLSLGCYCEDESRCHRSILRELLLARGAAVC